MSIPLRQEREWNVFKRDYHQLPKGMGPTRSQVPASIEFQSHLLPLSRNDIPKQFRKMSLLFVGEVTFMDD